ncbi:MAG: hypothetical protein II970_04945 [Paludibacteraceae bacterium]|nr:hypothetical protein [Paludibacteraceae bacterium]
MEKRHTAYKTPLTWCCITDSGLCQQFAVGSNANPDDAWAPGRRTVSFKPQGAN